LTLKRNKDITLRMRFTDIKYFGTFSGVIVGICLMLVSFILRLNILFINEIGKIPIYFWLVLVLSFILFSAFNNAIERTTLNWLYFILAIISFVYLNSMFQWSVECCPDKYDSMYDWNASKGLTWIVSVPITFFILIFQGLAYDLLRKRNFVKEKNI
jgi:hypothetical protein